MPKVVWVIATARFFSSASSFLMLFMTLYLTGPRGLSVPVAGVVAGAYGAGMLVGHFTGGRWGDGFGHRRVLLVCSTVVGVGTASVPWLPTAVLAVDLPVVAYLSATMSVSSGALLALAVDRGERRTAVALGRTALNAGFVVGPPLGALLLTRGYDVLFVVDGVMALLIRQAVGRVLPREPARAPEQAKGQGLWTTIRADRALMTLLPAVVLVDLVYRQIYSIVPLHLRDAGQPVALYTSLIAIGSGLILLLEIPVTVRLRGRSSYPIIATGYALVGVGFAIFALPVSIGTAVAAMVVLTAGEILYKTTATAHVLDAAPDHLVGQYQGLYSAAATSGTMLSAPIGGAIYAVAPGLVWPLCLVACLVAAGVVLASERVAAPAGATEPSRAV